MRNPSGSWRGLFGERGWQRHDMRRWLRSIQQRHAKRMPITILELRAVLPIGGAQMRRRDRAMRGHGAVLRSG